MCRILAIYSSLELTLSESRIFSGVFSEFVVVGIERSALMRGLRFCVHSVQKEGHAKDTAVAESRHALEVSVCPQYFFLVFRAMNAEFSSGLG